MASQEENKLDEQSLFCRDSSGVPLSAPGSARSNSHGQELCFLPCPGGEGSPPSLLGPHQAEGTL